MGHAMEVSFRRHEGVLLVCQNNDQQSLSVFAMNPLLQELCGYSEEEAKHLSLLQLLAPESAATVSDCVEYENDTQDLFEVMRKMRRVAFRHKNGSEIAAPHFSIVRIDARDRHHWFRLILQSDDSKRESEQIKRALTENFKGHEVFDEETGLPDRVTMEKDLELAQYYADNKSLSACFAYVRLDDYADIAARFGKRMALDAIKELASSLRQNLRLEDTIGRVGEDALGMILMDIAPESNRVVMNRIRWQISSHDLTISELKNRKLMTSFCFANIAGNGAPSLIPRCLEKLRQEAGASSLLVALD